MSVSRPWILWLAEYPDEGCIVVDARTEKEALRQGKPGLGITEGEDDTEVSCRPLVAQDFADLQDKLEEASRT